MKIKNRDEKSIECMELKRRADEALAEWKRKTGIRVILPKTANQLAEQKRSRIRARIRDREETRRMSHGAASEVRHVHPDGEADQQGKNNSVSCG
jgi:hypothetical protein